MTAALALKVATLAFVVAGMVLLVLSAQRAGALLALTRGTPFRRTWRILSWLMYGFAASYSVFFGLVLVDAYQVLIATIGFILGSGGLFVYLVTRSSLLSLRALADEAFARRHISDVLNALSDGIMLLDGDGIVTGVNREMCELCGTDEAALQGTVASELLGVAAELGGRSIGRLREGTLRPLSGTPIPVDVRFVEIQAVRGGSVTGLMVVRDRREFHRREAQLETAVKAAEVALRDRHGLNTLISAEVRPRLQLIMGAVEVLESASETDVQEREQALARARETYASLEDMLDGVVNSNNPRKGRERALEIGPILRRASVDLAKVAPSTTFDVSLGTGVPKRCYGRGSSLREILNGAGRFLLEASDPSKVRLSVERVPGDEERLLFVISSVGDEIEPRASTASGTGMGLAAARLLVHTLGGKLWINGDERTATEVSFTAMLPAIPSSEEVGRPTIDEMSPLMLIAAMTARSSAHSTMTGSVSLGNALVVDDSPPARLLLLHLVRELGYTAEAVGSGQECIDLATHRPFDLVLLDLVLPDINGIDVITALRESKVSARTSIVIVSSIGETRSIAACLERGADDYLTKPVNPMILRARLHGIHENRILAKQSGRQVARLEEEIRRADGLLRSILPAPVAHELQTTGAVVARRHPDVAVLFADVIGFTAYCEGKRPEDVLLDLQDLVKEFEALCRRHRVLKVKTIGDALMACGGLMDESEDATARCVELGFSLIEATARHPAGWSLRVGIHRGPVVAGIIGAQQFSYDIWGDTVNTAQRIEHHGVAGAVCVSAAARDAVPSGHTTRSVGISDVKGKGPLEIFVVSQP